MTIEADSSEDPQSGPRIGVCSWSLQPQSPRELLDHLQQLEVDAVQLALLPLIDEPRCWAECFEILRDGGIRVLSGMFATRHEDYSTLETIQLTGGVRPDEHWPEIIKSAIRVAELAAEHRLELVTLHAGFIPHERNDPLREVMLHRLRQFADVFGQRGVRIAFETGQESAPTLIEALDELDRPDVGVNFDPANMILYGMGDPVEAVRMLSDRIVQGHIKDALPATEPGAWGSEEPVGTGGVDWDAFLAVVAELPARPDLIIEREAGEARIADILTARRLIEQRFPGTPA